MSRNTRVIVVGAGIGGLAAALALVARGVEVLVLEQASLPGGKLREVVVGRQRLDAGPTVFTMRWVLDELFEEAGLSLRDKLPLQAAGTLARHAWDGGAALDLHADIERSVEAIAAFAGPAEGERYRGFCRRARTIYDTLEQPFLCGSRPSPFTLARRIGWAGRAELLGLSPFTTLWRALGRHFHDPRLRQLFGRYATYCGSSPFRAPATLMLVAHVEREGVWLVRGGMQRVADAMAQGLRMRGAEIRCDTHVAEILVAGGRARGVRLAGGETLEAAGVVFNGDVSALGAGLLGSAVARAQRATPTPVARRSLSALTWHCIGSPTGRALSHHNVFFSRDSEHEFDELLRQRRVPAEPTVYVCAQDRGPGDEAPCGAGERLMCLINAPADGDVRPLPSEELERCERAMQQTLARCGLSLGLRSPSPVVTTPSDFDRLFPATGGALYGQASHGWRASFSRPGSRSRIPGLYLAGGSTHPGPGLPMAALSGRLAAQALWNDLNRASTRPSHPVVMAGGTSTP